MRDLIVLGGGPAGLTATVYAIRKRLDVLLITQDLGGKVAYHLHLPFGEEMHHPVTGREIVESFVSQIQYLDFVRTFEQAMRVEPFNNGYVVQTQSGNSYAAKALIVATGAQPQMLGVPGEREFLGRGLSYSVISHAQLLIGRPAILVGKGSLALRGALEMAQIVRQLYLVAPDPEELSSPAGQKLKQAHNVTILEGYQVAAIEGDTFARGVVITREGEERTLEADAIFVELGLVPNSAPVAHLVELDQAGCIQVDYANRTSRAGIFAAGDVTNVYAEQVLIAVGEGVKAALSAFEYLLTLSGFK